MGFLGLKGFLSRGAPHEVGISVIRVMAQKGSLYKESSMCEFPIDLGGEPWLGIYHLVN